MLTIVITARATGFPAPLTRTGALVDVITGSVGAGHDAAAAAIAEQLEAEGYRTRIFDILDLMRRPLARSLRVSYQRQVQSTPTLWRAVLEAANHGDTANRAIAQLMRHTRAALLDLVRDAPAAIVSTHPFVSQTLGELRRSGRISVPVVTYLCDMSVHRPWVHRSVDLHLALDELPAAEAHRFGAGTVALVRPALQSQMSDRSGDGPLSLSRSLHGRKQLGLPRTGALVAVSGGSLGLGKLEQTAYDVLATGLARPVVVCGRNQRLYERLRRQPGVLALGWVSDMATLLGAVDGVIQNAGGAMSLEALAYPRPVLTYRAISGHGETNADALDRSGLAPWVRTPDEFGVALARALLTPACDPWASPTRQRPDVVTALREHGLL